MNAIIRLENENDYRSVEEVTREAFWNLYAPGCSEHYLCHIMRNHKDFIKELDYVAEIEGNITGSIMYSKALIISDNNQEIPIVSFGPLCVHPDFQRKGIGTALIEKTKGLVEKMGFPAIAIYGDPHNYCRHGFKNGIDYKVSNMDGDFPLGLLVLEIKPGFFGKEKWKLRQSDVFKFSQEEAMEFDKQFKDKEKKIQYSQEIFKIQIRSFLREAQLTIAST